MKNMNNLFNFTMTCFLLLTGLLIGQDSVIVIDDMEIDLTKLPQNDNCISCHIEEEILPEGFDQNDIHMQVGLSCAGCHGGNPNSDDEDIAMGEASGFIGVPDRKDIPGFCGKCHSNIEIMRQYQPRISTDQVSQYFTSVHGHKFKMGDKHVATCNSCHSSHKIMSAKDPRSTTHPLNIPETCNACHGDPDLMAEYGIHTNQYKEYAQSVHGKALLEREDTGAPACNDCHGNHGAAPPGIQLSKVCGTCHIQNEEYFSKSKMAVAFKANKTHECIACHGNHLIKLPTDEMVGIGKESICLDCHTEGDAGYMTADSINILLQSAVLAYDSALAKQKEVQIIGMDDVEMNFLLQDAHQDLIHSRTLVHTFDTQMVNQQTDESITNSRQAIQLGRIEIENYGIRRMGLAVATVFITILVISLIFKIRDLDKEKGVSK